MKLPFRYYGDPILRQHARAIPAITTEISQIVTDMIDTFKAHPGWGLAAPQIGHSLRIFISGAPDSREETIDHYGPVRVYINPKLSNPSQETRSHTEGCFSIPKVYPIITRPAGITIEAMDLDGNIFTQDLWGWQARVIMHENDHLNGVLAIDRVTPHQRQQFNLILRELKKRYHH